MYRDRLEEDVRNWYFKKPINEATSDSAGRGSYIAPLRLGKKIFDKSQLNPFNEPVSKYFSPLLAVDSYDGTMDEPKKVIKKIENKAKQSSNYSKNHPIQNDDDGDIINPTPGRNKKINEISSTVTSGPYSAPIEIGLKKWSDSELGPFKEHSKHKINKKSKQKTLKNNIKTVIGVWEKDSNGSYERDVHDVHTVSEWVEITENTVVEDLGVWFGTKKKPKGSKQPKGPWVNICRKDKDGKHPPCGRPDASSKGYPKCRAAGVAGKMSDSQKKSACQQKRRAEKTHNKSGTGNKPKMVSYKTKKESFSRLLKDVINEVIKNK
jgi:hypothetical protein